MNTTRKSFISSVIALLLCLSMFLGTTFAWFTDEVTSANNIIKAGVLDVNMQWSMDGTNWNEAEGEYAEPVFDYDRWEPGYTEVRYIKVKNDGNLAFKYELFINPTGTVGKLAEVIDVSYDIVTGNAGFVAPTSKENMGSLQAVGTLNDLISSNNAVAGGVLLPAQYDEQGYYSQEIVVCIAFHMQETAGNEYQGASIGDAFGINLYATQFDYENDSYGSSYDDDAEWPYRGNGYQFKKSISNKVDATGTLTQSVTVGDVDGQVYANVPNGIKLADDAEVLTLTVEGINDSNAGITATHRSQIVRSVDVHMDGIAEDNTVPMIINLKGLLPGGLNSNNVMLYHVEDGQTVEMTRVSDPTNHNEFSYDPATGDVVMALASFSEIATFAETDSSWDGETTDGSWFNPETYESTTTYTIANAEQLAYFRDLVDEGYTFEGKTVTLENNIYLDDHNFDPIGWGYEYDGFTADGKTFNGTFNGNNKTIFGLYQNGWEANDRGNTYDYGMDGGGLFASVCDATIMNLTISGADIVMECIDMGVVVGYAQGNCTFDTISIINCTIQNYNRYTGGVVGECSPRYNADGTPMHSNHIFNNINVDSTTVVSSLWGSFDTSLGGILGGKWDKNGAETQVTMTNCNVACTIDAFNDVTSAYQWYAYRRAGMLIGNTEQSASNKALANFLTCENVYVYYGEWNNYHYCEFTNQSGSDDASWQNNYPWVRVESGLSCGAYSNPRYGHPIVNGTAIFDSIHSHAGDDECMISLPFAQLYGGGQGVYGATEHPGVYKGSYTVTYINYGETIKVEFVGDNSEAHDLWNPEEYVYGETKAIAWVDANGNVYSESEKNMFIDAKNTHNIILYPKFQGEYTIRFLDAEKNVLYYEIFKEREAHTLNMSNVNAALSALQDKVDHSREVITVVWNTDINTIDFKNAKGDIIVEAQYSLANLNVVLEPVYDENDKEKIVAYKFVDYDYGSNVHANIVIPSHIGLTPIITIENNVFAGYTNLVSVELPNTMTHIGANAFEDGPNTIFGIETGGRSTITIYFNGSHETWKKYMDNFYKGNSNYTNHNVLGNYDDDYTILSSSWDHGLGDGSRIFFLDANGNVDNNRYWELAKISGKYIWIYHEHPYNHGSAHSGCTKTVSSNQYTDYINDEISSGKARPDQKYWVD